MVHLSNDGWLEGLTKEELQAVEEKGTFRSCRPRETVFYDGEKLTAYYLVVDGLISAYHQNSEGKKWVASLFSHGDLFPHVGLLNQARTYPASAETITSGTLFRLSRKAMAEILSTYPSIRAHLERFLTEKNQELMARISDSVFGTASGRLAAFLRKLVEKSGVRQTDGRYLLKLNMTEQDIAEYIGVTPETVSRILRDLYDKRAAEKAGKGKLIIRPDRL
ncbi:Crp/Fnr family transcriptional regulator [Sporolactobacillus sp. THM19-2]|uniref:Crp/Fnr family transcriptional regulator n=1 Tax=Sporolactobacillus sp. THM19-2 TaxID=2511171 RepID=UPI001020D831|nr:Crp/Fnr family transcriptional regulator [Sporolactobacillus sp. THM19-2]RYL92584.1 Crp/Fnr family transcriptional regulator [Sporolactobacillus sp. THM19-2]